MRLVLAWNSDHEQFPDGTFRSVSFADGRFLVNQLQDSLQIAGYGSYRYAFRPEWRMPPGTKIQVTFEVTDTTNQQPMAMFFDGAYQYLLEGRGRADFVRLTKRWK